MARTGFYDASQDLYLPKDGLQWSDLGSAPYQTWDSYTTWYKELSSSTELEYTSDIIDVGSNKKIFPLILLTVLRDGATSTSGSFGADFPKIVIEGSVNSDMSSASSVTITRTSSPNYTSVGSKRYYRVTTTINSGTNTAPQGYRGISIQLLTEAIEEVIEAFNTATVDDGSTVNRTIPTAQTYSAISFVGITPTTEITDTVVTGVSSDGSTLVLYVANGYVNTGYFVGDVGSSSVTSANVSIPPLVRLVSTGTNSFTMQVYKPNTADDTNVTFDALVKGLPPVAMDENGNIIRTA